MRFLDANIFIYAFYKPRGKLTPKQAIMKEKAKEVIKKLMHGEEEFLTTVIHISEVANILKKAMPLNDLNFILSTLYSLENLKIVGISEKEYMLAIEFVKEYRMDPNDCLAIYIMRREGINEIYSFDKGFESIDELVRLP